MGDFNSNPFRWFFTLFIIISISNFGCAKDELNQASSTPASEPVVNVDPDTGKNSFDPKISVQYSGGPEIFAGAEVTFLADFDSETVTYQWFHISALEVTRAITSSTSRTLTIEQIKNSQRGTYYLEITFPDTRMVRTNSIEIQVKSSFITTQPKSQKVLYGQTAVFYADIKKNLALRFAWQRKLIGMTKFEWVPANVTRIVGARDNTLVIHGAKGADIGEYRLVVVDDGVNGKTQIVSQRALLAIIYQQLGPNINDVLDSTHKLVFRARGVKPVTSGDATALSPYSQITWFRYDLLLKTWKLVMKNGQVHRGSDLDVKLNPRYPNYRARLMTKHNIPVWSRVLTMTNTNGYIRPISQTKNHQFFIGVQLDTPTVSNWSVTGEYLRIYRSSRSTGDPVFRWYFRGTSDTKWFVFKKYDDSPYHYQHLVLNLRVNYGQDFVKYFGRTIDPYWMYGDNPITEIRISNPPVGKGPNLPEATIARAKTGQIVRFSAAGRRYYPSDKAYVIGLPAGSTCKWDRKIGSIWVRLAKTTCSEIFDTSSDSPALRTFRVTVKIINDSKANIYKTHLFLIRKMN